MKNLYATEAVKDTEDEKKITEPGDLNNPPGTGADEADFEEDDEEDADDDDENEEDPEEEAEDDKE
jgi:hypothetical protein